MTTPPSAPSGAPFSNSEQNADKVSAWSLIKPYWVSSQERGMAWTLLIAIIVINMAVVYINVRLNKERKAKLAEETARRGWTEEDVQRERERHAFADLTDKQNLFFVYTC